MATKCFFNAGSWKCSFHSKRSRCLVPNCANQVYARGHCVRHGGRPRCRHENCEMNQRVGDFCTRHASPNLKRRCSEPGCAKQAHARGKCVRHGGGRLCKALGCPKYVRQSGYCLNHWYSLRKTANLSEPMPHDVSKQSIRHLLNDDIPAAADLPSCAIPFRMPFVPN